MRLPDRLLSSHSLFFFVLLFLLTMKTHRTYMGEGDEPHYMVVSESLLLDQDIDLRNNYVSPRLREFNDRHVVIKPDGRQFPFHGIGLSLAGVPILALVRFVFDHVPESVMHHTQKESLVLTKNAASFFMMMLAGAMAILFYKTLVSVGFQNQLAWILSLVVALSPPFLSYGFLFFTELPAGFLSFYVFSCFLQRKPLSFKEGLALGYLPLLHVRYYLVAAFLLTIRGVAIFSENKLSRIEPRFPFRERLIAFLSFFIWVGVYFFNRYMWGGVTPEANPIDLRFLPISVPAQFFDRSFGLFIFSPLYFLVGAGGCALYRFHKSWAIGAMGAVVLIIAPVMGFPVWWGGWSPGPRYLAPAAPFLAFMLVSLVREMARTVQGRRLLNVGLALTLLLSILYWQHPMHLWNKECVGIHQFFIYWFGPAGQLVQQIWPNFFIASGMDFFKLAVMIIAFIVINGWFYHRFIFLPSRNGFNLKR